MVNGWSMLDANLVVMRRNLSVVTSGRAGGIHTTTTLSETETNIPNGVACSSRCGHYCFGRSAVAAQFLAGGAVAGRHHIDGDGLPARTGRPSLCSARPGRKAFDDSTSSTVRSRRRMTQLGERASGGSCDADIECLHVACFQVQLDVARPGQDHRHANACAYHVPEVIQALRAWAGEHGVADGQLTILAVEPAASGRPPGFAFSRIPLDPVPRRDPARD